MTLPPLGGNGLGFIYTTVTCQVCTLALLTKIIVISLSSYPQAYLVLVFQINIQVTGPKKCVDVFFVYVRENHV